MEWYEKYEILQINNFLKWFQLQHGKIWALEFQSFRLHANNQAILFLSSDQKSSNT